MQEDPNHNKNSSCVQQKQDNDLKLKYKFSLCRHFLRGNCQYLASQCQFAHGLQQLRFVGFHHVQNEAHLLGVFRDFRIRHPVNQLDDIVDQANKNYINLYEFQFQIPITNNTETTQPEHPQQHISSFSFSPSSCQSNKMGKKEGGEYQEKKESPLKNKKNVHKIHSLEQINTNRNIKILLRKQFHQHQFQLFLNAIAKVYSNPLNQDQLQDQYMFAHQIVESQYYRVGFNKLMTRIKFSFLIDYLQSEYKSGYYKLSTTLPPIVHIPQSYYLRPAPLPKIHHHYHQIYHNLLLLHSQKSSKPTEQQIRHAMMKSIRPSLSIPPLNHVLKMLSCTFKQFVQQFLGGSGSGEWVKLEDRLLGEILGIVKEQVREFGFCDTRAILQTNPKFNRTLIEKCIEEQSKKTYNSPQLLLLVKLPNIKTELITKKIYLCPSPSPSPSPSLPHNFGIMHLPMWEQEVRKQSMKNLLPQNQSILSTSMAQMMMTNSQVLNHDDQGDQGEKIFDQLEPDTLDMYTVVEIVKVQELLNWQHIFVERGVLFGVDLEGNLSTGKESYLSLIQINHYSQKIIFLIDYLTIQQNSTQQQLLQCKTLLSKFFRNPNKIKIIHDSRKDAEFLYHILKHPSTQSTPSTQPPQSTSQSPTIPLSLSEIPIQLTNIFDTAASQQVIDQVMNKYEGNIVTPGLNQVLERHGQPCNIWKKKFHGMWEMGVCDPSMERPITQQFMQYCAMDVLGLPKVFKSMCQQINPYFLMLVSQLHANSSKTKAQPQKNIQFSHPNPKPSENNKTLPNI